MTIDHDFSQFKEFEVSHPDIQYIIVGEMYAIYGDGFTLAFFDDKDRQGMIVNPQTGGTEDITEKDFVNCLIIIQFLYTIIEDCDII